MAASRKEVPRYETRELAALSVSSAKHEASDVPSNATPSVWRTVRSVLGIAEGRAVWGLEPADLGWCLPHADTEEKARLRDERSVGERAPGERPQRRTSERASVELSGGANGASVERK